MTILEFFRMFKDYDYEINYIWDNTPYIASCEHNNIMLVDDYPEEEIDEEFSFGGCLDDFEAFIEEYSCYDEVDILDHYNYDIEIFIGRRTIVIDLVVPYYG